jgi:hypothetical protein
MGHRTSAITQAGASLNISRVHIIRIRMDEIDIDPFGEVFSHDATML